MSTYSRALLKKSRHQFHNVHSKSRPLSSKQDYKKWKKDFPCPELVNITKKLFATSAGTRRSIIPKNWWSVDNHNLRKKRQLRKCELIHSPRFTFKHAQQRHCCHSSPRRVTYSINSESNRGWISGELQKHSPMYAHFLKIHHMVHTNDFDKLVDLVVSCGSEGKKMYNTASAGRNAM